MRARLSADVCHPATQPSYRALSHPDQTRPDLHPGNPSPCDHTTRPLSTTTSTTTTTSTLTKYYYPSNYGSNGVTKDNVVTRVVTTRVVLQCRRSGHWWCIFLVGVCLIKTLATKQNRWNQNIMSETGLARAARHGPGPFYTRSVRTHLNLTADSTMDSMPRAHKASRTQHVSSIHCVFLDASPQHLAHCSYIAIHDPNVPQRLDEIVQPLPTRMALQPRS